MRFVENTQGQVGAVFLWEFIACCWTVCCTLGDGHGDEIMAAQVKIESHYKESGRVLFFAGRVRHKRGDKVSGLRCY